MLRVSLWPVFICDCALFLSPRPPPSVDSAVGCQVTHSKLSFLTIKGHRRLAQRTALHVITELDHSSKCLISSNQFWIKQICCISVWLKLSLARFFSVTLLEELEQWRFFFPQKCSVAKAQNSPPHVIVLYKMLLTSSWIKLPHKDYFLAIPWL